MKFPNAEWTFRVVALICFLILIANLNLINRIKFNPASLFNSLKPLKKLDENFLAQIETFKSKIVSECDTRNFTLKSTCIPNVKQFDNYLLNLRSQKLNVADGCTKCLNFLDKTTNKSTLMKVFYHPFWNLNSHGTQMRMAKLNILSYLATQNLCCSKMFVWVLEGSKASFESTLNGNLNIYLKNGFVEIKEFTLAEFCESGFFKNKICLDKSMKMNNFAMVSLSDLVRFAVLDKYGG